MPRATPLLSARELVLGGVERHGEFVSMTHEHGVFMIRRHPAHPAGHKVSASKTLRYARTLASGLRNEKPSA